MQIEAFITLVERIAPLSLAEEWDHSGIQISCGTGEIQRVLTCLDVTGEVIAEAQESGADMIVSHHPFIFDGIYSLDANNPMGKKIQDLIRSGISVYSAHMTYDKSNGGNTVQLSKRLGLSGYPLPGKASGEDQDFSVLVATLPKPVLLEELIDQILTGLKIKQSEIRLVQGSQEPIRKIGLCAGGGGDALMQILEQECQVFITGDVKYHLAMEAMESGITLIDAGHFGTEKFFASDFAGQLAAIAGPGVSIVPSRFDKNPFST